FSQSPQQGTSPRRPQRPISVVSRAPSAPLSTARAFSTLGAATTTGGQCEQRPDDSVAASVHSLADPTSARTAAAAPGLVTRSESGWALAHRAGERPRSGEAAKATPRARRLRTRSAGLTPGTPS